MYKSISSLLWKLAPSPPPPPPPAYWPLKIICKDLFFTVDAVLRDALSFQIIMNLRNRCTWTCQSLCLDRKHAWKIHALFQRVLNEIVNEVINIPGYINFSLVNEIEWHCLELVRPNFGTFWCLEAPERRVSRDIGVCKGCQTALIKHSACFSRRTWVGDRLPLTAAKVSQGWATSWATAGNFQLVFFIYTHCVLTPFLQYLSLKQETVGLYQFIGARLWWRENHSLLNHEPVSLEQKVPSSVKKVSWSRKQKALLPRFELAPD